MPSFRLSVGVPLTLVAAFAFITQPGNAATLQIHVHPKAPETSGAKSNKVATGTTEAPFETIQAARDHLRSLQAEQKLPEGGAVVHVHAGRYPISETLVLDKRDSGTAECPIVYKSVVPHQAVLDGANSISLHDLAPVQEKDSSRLAPSARGKVRVISIKDSKVQSALKRRREAMLMMDGRLMLMSRFPNIGFAHAKELLHEDEGTRWQDAPVRGTYESPNGAVFTLRETPAGSWEQWSAEVTSHRHVFSQGYLSAQWYRESMPIASVDSQGAITYLSETRYGLKEMVERFQSRLAVRGLLCEIDSPGEWYFDRQTNQLYFWPPESTNEESRLSLAASKPAVEIRGAAHLTMQGFIIEGVASGSAAVSVSGSNNRVAGCVIRNCNVSALNISGHHNTVTSCDVYDVRHLARLSGGRSYPDRIDEGENQISNCHFFMDQRASTPAQVSVSGAGNRFTNNLLHNLPGQAIVFRGNNQHIARNELFNIGFEEGDGAAIYAGAEFWGYGSKIQHNFLHHIMSTDGLMTRSAIMLDDHDSGREVIGNIFYKSGYGSLAINGGTGLTIRDNLFLKGQYGVWVRVIGNVKERIAMQAKFDSGELNRGDKHDYIWRCEQVVGEEGWNHPFWKESFPVFAKVMNHAENDDNLRFYPIENDVQNTIGYRMRKGLTFQHSAVPKGRLNFKETRQLTDDDYHSLFVDTDKLDFRWASPQQDWMPSIPFSEIGLYKDNYRKSVPDPQVYREIVRKRFQDRESCNRNAKYDFDHVNETIYWNSGQLLHPFHQKSM